MPTLQFAGGADAGHTYGQRYYFRFSQNWADGETYSISLGATLEGNITLGVGNLMGMATAPATGSVFSALTLSDRVYLGYKTTMAFCSPGDATLWEEQNPGAGTLNFVNQFGNNDQINGLASYQGKLAIFGRYSIQIWSYDADPNAFQRIQLLSNIGTVAPMSVQSLGDLDVLFLSDTGVRSLRVRDSSLNAYVVDLGTPIDSLVQAGVISAGTAAHLSAGVIEPGTGRYWLNLFGTIYVLSYFPSSKIIAWSTFKPTYDSVLLSTTPNYDGAGTNSIAGLTVGMTYVWAPGAHEVSITCGTTTLTAAGSFVATATTALLNGTSLASYTGVLTQTGNTFTVEKFVVFGGQVYVKGTDNKVYIYGGVNNLTYDHTQAIMETPYHDDRRPTQSKMLESVDMAIMGAWDVYLGVDPASAPSDLSLALSYGSVTSPNENVDSTFDLPKVPVSAESTHFKFRFVSSILSTAVAKISSYALHFRGGEND